VDEFIKLIFSFPLDPPPELFDTISESVYANSSTLDGRRFATEFCEKRKADAVGARSRGTGGAGPSAGGSAASVKPASLADVVKMQPKQAQSDWGYKVVRKKGKSGRGN